MQNFKKIEEVLGQSLKIFCSWSTDCITKLFAKLLYEF